MLVGVEPDAIILTGGKGSRLGGVAKPWLRLGANGESLLQAAVDACPGRVIVAGQRGSANGVTTWVADLATDAGPAAGVAAALAEVESEFVLLLAGDQLVPARTLELLIAAAQPWGVAWVVDETGVGNPLCAAVRTELLKGELLPDKWRGVSLRKVLQGLGPATVGSVGVRDFDTWSEVRKEVGGAMAWLGAVAEHLDVDDIEVPQDDLLSLTRSVAHGVERKMAPLTTFLIGVAVGRGMDEHEAVARVVELVATMSANDE